MFFFLKFYLITDTRVFEKLEAIVKMAIPEVLGLQDVHVAEGFQTCNRATLPIYFRASFVALVEAVKNASNPSSTPKSAKSTLKYWSKVIHILNSLVVTVKSNEQRNILITCLKYGRLVVEVFCKTAMPLLDRQFKYFPAESQELVRNLQTSTRMLQNVCQHVKRSRDAIMALQVPAMKRTLEQLLYRVKTMLAANGCSSAFDLGNLKNKDLKGEEIKSSQSTDDEQQQPQNDSNSDEKIYEMENEETDDDDDVTGVIEDPVDSDSQSREY